MSKVDAQRALRDARFARYAAAKKSETAPAKKSSAKAPATKAAAQGQTATPAAEPVPDELFDVTTAAPATTPDTAATVVADSAAPSAEAPEEPETEDEMCGHRSMNGRTCTRTKGHEQRTHRYN